MNISIIGSKGLAKQLGKKGTSSDITLYNTSFQGRYFTFIEPEKYPEKVQTLFQAMSMSQFTILYLTADLPKNILGECIIAVDTLKKKGAIVLDVMEKDEIKPILQETSLRDFPILENNPTKIFEFLSEIEQENIQGKPKVVIDHSFLVKSVGNVALGTVASGEIKKYDKLTLFPAKKEVMIKSIQIHDKDYDKASCGDRLGVSVKGAEVEELKRGSVISDRMDCLKELSVSITKNKFFKDDIPNEVMCIIGLQYVRAEMKENKLLFESEIAYDGEKIIILTPEKKMRVFGVAAALSET
ncbi:MAG: hypothetical protein COY38_04370 [Candidatus Aenigmarchaeota archaeon CG_4_10_14_0_8_um_filter_37_24]|nr:hypothetical protein [Candidatus Aenigmarchaeota archaeon]OIN85335.1 MAG: hypothetical protein AUJ50_05165 [Candidatus Aenigmarchaeota archaeon CG1_02_38_14]PIW40881.1 MAG: hypothetical protein COW21_04765 [Candidatus Aenigmarchaeota archaeon CG15_BIG_FIL_POST_REV_8_21_14_020_37_27]PIX51154.1 MAG: hypothetical protein COZ52_00245 [Candidatus Aenigmarchaeota archaeon CG_4_8_14_3_um_filter_37_24]PIY36477.1 MAG: hypothetical protein COZ04_00065 [Candidatus Aenigmarchaeota archaeon CG_4_10_14_3_